MNPGVLAAMLAIFCGHSSEQTPAPAPAADEQVESKLELDATIDASRSGAARWWQITPSATYTFSPRWSIEVGLPIYAVNGALTDDGVAHGGVGDVYGSVALDASNDHVTFYSTLSGAAPTGSYANGLGAGMPTYDWTNHVAIERGPFSPYADAGFANSLNTAARNGKNGPGGTAGRPVVAIGNFFQAEGGVDVALWGALSTSLSAYVVRPFNGARPAAPRLRRPGLPPGVAAASVADLDRDHGVSATLSTSLTSSLDVSAWFWRSLRFHYDTVSISLNINLSALMNRGAAGKSAPTRR